MLRQDKLPSRVSFRLDDESLDQLEELSVKLQRGQSEVLRIAVKRLVESYGGAKSDVLIMSRPEFDEIINKFSEQVTKNSRESLDRYHSNYMQVIDKLLSQPAIKEALKSVNIEDIQVKQ